MPRLPALSPVLLLLLCLAACSPGPPAATRATTAGVPADPTSLPAAVATAGRAPGTPPAPSGSATRTPPAGPGRIVPTGALAVPRAAHTATLLATGRVLIAGGCTARSCELADAGATAELFDPATGTFAATGRMAVARVGHRAVPLRDGTVLIVGGWGPGGTLASAEIYDPRAGSFAPTGSLRQRRGGHSATVLADGRVLVAGGTDGTRPLASAEIYDPAAGTFAPTGDLLVAREGQGAVALPDGAVLLLGGGGGRGVVLAGAERFDPATGRFARAADLTLPRHKHAALALDDGRVLVVGGSDARDFAGRYRSAEVCAPAPGACAPLADLALPRFKLGDAVVRLPSGAVLVAGGGDRAELLDPGAARFRTLPGDLGAARAFATATALPDGRALIVGGYDERLDLTAQAWLYVDD